jgi:hypothetical protein
VLVVSEQPLEDLDPQLRFVLAPVGHDREFREEASQTLRLRPAWEKKADLGEHRRAQDERPPGQSLEVAEGSPILRVPRIAQGHDRPRSGLYQAPERFVRDPSVLEYLRQQLRPDPLAFVDCEDERTPVIVKEKTVTAAATRLAKTGARQSRQYPASG